MKILVTGGTGFVGTELCKQLRALKHDVRLLVRTSSVDKLDPDHGYDIVSGDVLDSHACLRAAADCDAVVNLVGIRREFPQVGTTYKAMHTAATFNVVNGAKRAGVERIIQMSGLGASPDARAGYHRTKYEAEKIVQESGMRWTVFRPSVIFGPCDEFHSILADLAHRPLVPIIDGGTTQLQPVSLGNVAAAMAASVTMPETQGRVIEVGGPDRVVFVDLLHQVARHYGLWMNTVNVSSRLMTPAVKALQRFKSFPLTLEELYMLLEDNICDTEDFVSTFGVELDSYTEALPKLLVSLDAVAA